MADHGMRTTQGTPSLLASRTCDHAYCCQGCAEGLCCHSLYPPGILDRVSTQIRETGEAVEVEQLLLMTANQIGLEPSDYSLTRVGSTLTRLVTHS